MGQCFKINRVHNKKYVMYRQLLQSTRNKYLQIVFGLIGTGSKVLLVIRIGLTLNNM